MQVLGSPVSFDNVPAVILGEQASEHERLSTQTKNILCSKTSVDGQLRGMLMLVRPAALWACATWSINESLLKGINTLQLQLLRKAIGGQRRPGEEWVEWNQRTLRLARLHLMRKAGGVRWSTFVLSSIWKLHGHVARREGPLKEIQQWRCVGMVGEKQQQLRGGARHARRFCPAP